MYVAKAKRCEYLGSHGFASRDKRMGDAMKLLQKQVALVALLLIRDLWAGGLE